MAFVEHSKLVALTGLVMVSCLSGNLRAHGGVVLEDDLCLINVGFYQAHFTLFQPRTRGHQQFCEDLPDLGESIFVLEYLHDGLERMAVDLRIIRNVTGAGQFARAEDVEALPDLQAVTVFYHPPERDPDAFTALHQFTNRGEYIGIVTARNMDNQTTYTAVFPFEVAVGGFGDSAVTGILIVAIALALALFGRWWGNRRQPVSASNATLLICLCLAGLYSPGSYAEPLQSKGERLSVFITPSLQPLQINRMHHWRVRVTDQDNQPVTGASFSITGGMPLHDHGLPAAPRMTRELSNGTYLIEGMKFHMHGLWQIQLQIISARASETVQVEVEL